MDIEAQEREREQQERDREQQEIIQANTDSIHPNPDVQEAAKRFDSGELLHKLGRCVCCQQLRPMFHATLPVNAAQECERAARQGDDGLTTREALLQPKVVQQKVWKLSDVPERSPMQLPGAGGAVKQHFKLQGDAPVYECQVGLCDFCKRDKRNRRESAPAMWSGHKSEQEDPGGLSALQPGVPLARRHNNMQFLPVPPYLQVTLLSPPLIPHPTTHASHTHASHVDPLLASELQSVVICSVTTSCDVMLWHDAHTLLVSLSLPLLFAAAGRAWDRILADLSHHMLSQCPPPPRGDAKLIRALCVGATRRSICEQVCGRCACLLACRVLACLSHTPVGVCPVACFEIFW